MLEGNMFFPDVGIPILKSARYNIVFAVALPDPFTVQSVMQKSFTDALLSACVFVVGCSISLLLSW
jgi:hypothetical protein